MASQRDYYVSFKTKEMPGLIQAVKVSIGTIVVRDPSTNFKINLCDDPLYPELVRYVRANPPRED